MVLSRKTAKELQEAKITVGNKMINREFEAARTKATALWNDETLTRDQLEYIALQILLQA